MQNANTTAQPPLITARIGCRLLATLLVLPWLCNVPLVSAADEDLLQVREQAALRSQWPSRVAELERLDLTELLAERWFEVEIVLFERLAVLDANTDEDLVSHAPRSWPQNISMLRTATQSGITRLNLESRYCLGYPELAIQDPVHPSRLQNEFDAESLLELTESAIPQAAPRDTDTSLATTDAQDNAAANAAAIDPAIAGQAGLSIAEPAAAPAPATELEQFLIDVLAFETELYNSSFTPLTELTLVNDVKALNRRRHLRPLLHQRWRQPVPERGNPLPLMLHTSADMPITQQGLAQVEGYIAVTVSRYLHVSTRLWYHADTLGLSPVALPLQKIVPPPIPGYMQLAQNRRLRSEELHYLDHPKLGLLISIQPIAVPDSLLQKKTALLAAATGSAGDAESATAPSGQTQ